MINEICQFVKTLENEAPQILEDGGGLKEGIYVALDIKLEDGKFYLSNVNDDGEILSEDIGIYTKKTEMNPFFDNCRQIIQNSNPVSAAKIFNPNKKIFNATCSPYAVGFAKKIIDKNLSTIGRDGVLKELAQYLKKAEEFVEDGQSRVWFEGFKNYLLNHFWQLLELIGYKELKDASTIIFMLKELTIEDYKTPYQKYLGLSVFNKAEYNATYNDIIYGISDSLSSFNTKKQFLQHQSASFKYNYRINGEDAQLIWKFYQLSKNNQLPNPLPIFVDKNEADLNTDEVTLFNSSDEKVSYSDIIRSLLNERKKNLQNFYLLFIQKGQIIDLDFVPLFHYQMNNEISNIIGIPNPDNHKLKNVFDLEKIFNDVFTVNHNDSGIGYGFLIGNYFTDKIESQKQFKRYTFPKEILTIFYKYRYCVYDYIYKSKRNAITFLIFNDMMFSSVVADISCDEFKNNQHTKYFSIRKKLNIWFSLYDFFEQNILKQIDMKQNLKQHREMMQELIAGKQDINSDEEFAFVSGQTIYYIFSKSVSADKSYSKLEPFLQKSDCGSFKQTIVRIFDTYKHENFSSKFSKSMAQIMDYDTDKNMKELTPYVLAGFFAENLLFADKDNE